ncbi:MAG: VOC family protein [Hamadaea sp.]|uniref:VOC family protein n=1 Tax=Hamadaea sp. TaxID=2024425 RepID=UPI0017C8C4A6|nr:VOC family protein [Hamadaea sp.]NUR74412.1 VOC family protein [Hamadaea sp.]NUT22936.1 VOC family protein [Hamadaea sp.]
MTALIRHITVDCADPYSLAGFWSEATGYPRHPSDEPGADQALLVAPDGEGPGLLFARVPAEKIGESRAGRRIHLDIMPTDGTRDAEVERLKKAGATEFEDHRNADGTGWVTMADPEGNLFCVERSAAERV